MSKKKWKDPKWAQNKDCIYHKRSQKKDSIDHNEAQKKTGKTTRDNKRNSLERPQYSKQKSEKTLIGHN